MKTKTWINLIAAFGLLVATVGLMPYSQPIARAATIVHVKPGGSTSAGCGTSWATACELQTALTNASAGNEVWAAAGTYKPGANREDTFQLISGVALYGGFAGTETAREQRDWETNETILSGDIGVPDDSSDNSYHVVTMSWEVDVTAILDGFTITGGNADDSRGGGMTIGSYSGPTLTNLIFIGNQAAMGGGIFMDASGPKLTNVIFSGNTAKDSGGGMYNMLACPSLTNVTFSGNTAGRYGGGMVNDWNYYCETMLTNVIFSYNSADYGGGLYNSSSISPTLTNTIMWGNTAGTSGAQIYNASGATPYIQFSDVQGGCASIAGNDCSGGGNIDADPLFVRNPDPGPDGTWGTVDDDYGDLRLKYGSPTIDAGDNTAPGLVGITTDLGGKPRFYDVPGIADTGVGPAPVIDMGAYEKQANDAPAAANDSYKTYQNTPLHKGTPGILANDSDPDGEMLTAVLENGPSSGSLTLNPDGSFIYIPETDYHGVVTFTYRATDGVLNSIAATVTITIKTGCDVYLPMIARCPALYQDDFSDPESGWPIDAGADFRLEYKDGKYRIWMDYTDGWIIARPDILAANYSLSVVLENVNDVYGTYGLVFGLSNDWSQFYTFEIDPQGYYSIFLYDNDDWFLLSEGFSSDINQGSTSNHLKVVRNGPLIEAWVNGQILTSISNGAYTGQRYVGLIASTYDERNLDIRFDDFLVEAIACGAGTVKADENSTLMRHWERGEQFTRSSR